MKGDRVKMEENQEMKGEKPKTILYQGQIYRFQRLTVALKKEKGSERSWRRTERKTQSFKLNNKKSEGCVWTPRGEKKSQQKKKKKVNWPGRRPRDR